MSKYLTFLIAGLLSLPTTSFSQETADIEADQLRFDASGNTALAEGDVKILYRGHQLKAGSVQWNQVDDVINAQGNIELTTPEGTVLTSDVLNLEGGLQNGTLSPIGILLTDQSRIGAQKGERVNGTLIKLQEAHYTACAPCATDPEKAPFWQISSRNATQDSAAQTMRYWHNSLDIYGVPVLYIPYFEHPTPEVKKKSGFMPPLIGQDGRLGANLTTPYFWNIAPNYDLTIAPKFTADEGLITTLDWRHMTQFGAYDVSLIGNDPRGELATIDGDTGFRSGVIANGAFANNNWTLNFEIKEPSDDLFFDRYRIDGDTTLSNRVELQNNYDGGHINLSFRTFRNIEENFAETNIHKILPMISHQHELDVKPLGGRLHLANQIVHSVRDFGADLTELRSRLDWTRAYISTSGLSWNFSNRMQFDGFFYNTRSDDVSANRAQDDTYVSNVTSVQVDYPLIKFNDSSTQTLTPRARVIGAMNDENYRQQYLRSGARKDLSQAFLFSLGNAGTETSRLDYGLAYELAHQNGIRAEFFAGQSYNLDSFDLPEQTGYGADESNIISSAKLRYGALDLRTELRFDQNGGDILRNQTRIGVAFKRLNLSTGYSFYEQGQIGDRLEEATYNGRFDISDKWRLAGQRRDNLRSGSVVSESLALQYEDECTLFEIRYSKDNAEIGNLKPSSSINLVFTLKTLGG